MAGIFRITDGKGFGMPFANGWRISVQFGRGNYADNYDIGRYDLQGYREANRIAGEQGSSTAECAVFNDTGDMVKLPEFMFHADEGYTDVVSNRSTPEQVLQLMNWAAAQPSAKGSA